MTPLARLELLKEEIGITSQSYQHQLPGNPMRLIFGATPSGSESSASFIKPVDAR
jgi:hypothetical protein